MFPSLSANFLGQIYLVPPEYLITLFLSYKDFFALYKSNLYDDFERYSK